jgi:hypothetical protein
MIVLGQHRYSMSPSRGHHGGLRSTDGWNKTTLRQHSIDDLSPFKTKGGMIKRKRLENLNLSTKMEQLPYPLVGGTGGGLKSNPYSLTCHENCPTNGGKLPVCPDNPR